MAHRVKCYYCGITFDRDKVVDCVKVNGSRYAHLECHLKAQDEKTQEEKDLEALEQYIIELLQIDYINQGYLGHTLSLFKYSDNNIKYLLGKDEDKVIFIIKLKIMPK